MSTIVNTLKNATLRMSSMQSINCGNGRNFVAPTINMMMSSDLSSFNQQPKFENSQFNNNNGSGPFKFNTYIQPFERTPFVVKSGSNYC